MADLFPARWTPRLLSVLRIVTAIVFIPHGSQKLFGDPLMENRGAVGLATLQGVAGILEFFGGLLILLGLGTRPIAFLLSGEMAVAYFLRHQPQAFWPIQNRGELAAIYCFLFLYLAAAGGGPWSLDAVLGRRRQGQGLDEARRRQHPA